MRILSVLAVLAAAFPQVAADRLTSKAAAQVDPPAFLKVGEEVTTAVGERKRVRLEDGGILYVNASSAVKATAAGRIEVRAGEVYAETERPMRITAGGRDVRAEKAAVLVRFDKAASSVAVTRGSAVVAEGMVLSAGWQVTGERHKTPIPRASHLLDWTKELHAGSPLVPASDFAGGSLLARDADGQEAKITLRKMHVDVYIEDGFARTTIDQTYFNHEGTQLEGQFYFPLPPDASLSYFAMYVDGYRMEAGMVERDRGRNIYETIRHANRDPALLEWVDGSTFKMRVFPLEARTEKRILLSYTQRLSSLYGQTQYRFPAGHSLQSVEQWSFQATVKDGAALAWQCPSHELKAAAAHELVLRAAATKARTDRDVVLNLSNPAAAATDTPRFTSARHEGAEYLLLRYRPELQTPAERARRRWLVLFESSGDRDPLLARAQIEIVRTLLQQAEPTDTFLVAAASTRVRLHHDTPVSLTPENAATSLRFLENAHLVGALDLSAALQALAPHVAEQGETMLVHVGSGISAMGTADTKKLVGSVPARTQYVGVGVGRRWNRAFMKAAAEASGGYFTQINPDEPIAWRTFDLSATLNTPRLLHVTAESVDADAAPLLVFQETLAQGEELAAITRAGPPLAGLKDAKTTKLPTKVRIRGTLAGQPYERIFDVKIARADAGYLPRTWARLEIDRLLAADAAKHREAIVALSKSLYVMSPFTSMLVLENDDMYKQYHVDRDRRDHWAAYPSPAKIAVVCEPEPGQPDPKRAGEKPRAQEVAKTVPIRSFELEEQRQNIKELLHQAWGHLAEVRKKQVNEASAMMQLSLALNAMQSELFDLSHPEPMPGSKTFNTVSGAIGSTIGVSQRAEATIPTVTKMLIQNSNQEGLDYPVPMLPPGPFSSIRYEEGGLYTRRPQRRGFFDIDGSATGAIGNFVGRGEEMLAIPKSGEFDAVLSELDMIPHHKLRMSRDGLEVQEQLMGFRNDTPLGVARPLRTPIMPALPAPALALEVGAGRSLHTSITGGLLGGKDSDGSDRLYFDLLSYAPGMDTSLADRRAVIETEAQPAKGYRVGTVDAAARKLIERARMLGWHAYTAGGVTIVFDGAGRYAYERTLPIGLKERVVCDGTTIVHLYPQLQVGATRAVSRFHRAEAMAFAPWMLGMPEDFAHGADVALMDDATIALVPHFEKAVREWIAAQPKDAKTPQWTRWHLRFATDGRLAEKQLVRQPSGKVMLRQVFEKSGVVRLLDDAGKELAKLEGTLAPAPAPELTLDTKDVVVVPMPYRSLAHVRERLKMKAGESPDLRFAQALPLLAACVAENNAVEAQNVFNNYFARRDQKQLGYYVLLAAAGVNLDADRVDVQAEHPDAPLAQYLALHTSPVLRKHASQWAVTSASWADPMLKHLATTHAIFQRWQSDKLAKSDKLAAERTKAFEYIRKHHDVFGFSLLTLVQRKTDREKQKDFFRELAGAYDAFAKQATFGPVARYEAARCLYVAGDLEAARTRYLAHFETHLKDNQLPPVDEDFRRAFADNDRWGELMRGAARAFVKDKRRADALVLAMQASELEDQPLMNALVDIALVGADAKERPSLTLAAISLFHRTNQLVRADTLLQSLLGDKDLAKDPALWHIAGRLAHRRDMPARFLECLEKGLDAEFASLPERFELAPLRDRSRRLLGEYQKLADAMVTLGVKPVPDFTAKVVRAADRWRAIDRETDDACVLTSNILHRLGQSELAWDYLTTRVAQRPSESDGWLNIAQDLRRKGDLTLADAAFRSAYEAEPTNAQILWDRAENLNRAGKPLEARTLLRQLADGNWQPRFQNLKTQAKSQLP